MKKPTIKVENISKKYTVGKPPANSIQDLWKNLWLPYTKAEDFWALKNISFELHQGEVLGVLGKNGAGKSTLLKILARITAPTSGKVLINGKLNSLLELGTGFHPDFTGRENIFLNGTLLGMQTYEIKQKFDEIVDFSGVEEFIDTPVKQYSSGMYIRLAFAVAAHLDAEIVLIDEVLTVGDMEFQQKSLNKIEQMIKNGKTLLIVSHNLHIINKICKQGLVLSHNTEALKGDINHCINYYLQNCLNDFTKLPNVQGVFELINTADSNSQAITQIRVFCDNQLTTLLYTGCNLKFEIDFSHTNDFQDLLFGFVIKTPQKQEIIGINNLHIGTKLNPPNKNKGTIIVDIPNLLLYGEGRFMVDLYLGDNSDCFLIIKDAFYFDLLLSDVYSSNIFLSNQLNLFVQPNVKIKCS